MQLNSVHAVLVQHSKGTQKSKRDSRGRSITSWTSSPACQRLAPSMLQHGTQISVRAREGGECRLHPLGGSDCLSFSAFPASSIFNVYKYFEHRSLNFVTVTVLVRPVDWFFLSTFDTFTRAAACMHITMSVCLSCLSCISFRQRTLCVFPPRSFKELLDIFNFLRHD